MSGPRRPLWYLWLGAAAAALAATAVAMVLLRAAVGQRGVERLRAEAALAADWAADPAAAGDAQAFAERVARRLGVRVTLVSADGRVVGDSSRDPESLAGMENHAERPEIHDARLRGSGENRRVSQTTNVMYHYVAFKVPGSGPLRYVRLSQPVDELGRVPARYVALAILLVLGATVALVVAGRLELRRLTRPIEQLAHDVERSAAGGFRTPIGIPPRAGDETERLATGLRRLQLALLEKLDELGDEGSILASVIAGMREGLLLVGPDRRVRLANDALRRILDLPIDPLGHLIEEVVRHPEVVRDLDAALDEGREVQESVIRLPGSERVFELHAVPLGPAKRAGGHEVLALFVDVTRLDRLEKVRREFVANVSHELRTPLTSIKAFVENLLDGGMEQPESAQRFLEIVRRHADHMGELIEDLTDLSLIETGAVTLELRRVDASEVAREIAEQLRPLARAREVDVRLELPAPFHVVADRRRLAQMLTNLVHNAIKFNRPGGRVTLSGRSTPEGTRLVVEDTGIGIPSSSIEQVFERFFQVSRDRSRDVGGTGLGLSIVKHLMRLHGGRVSLESELGRGSRFTLEFPGSDTERRVVPLAAVR